MESSPRLQEYQMPSPNSHTTTTGNGLHHHRPSPPTTQPPSLPIRRSDTDIPYPTTFVQADTSSFKQVVQMLTGSTETGRPESLRNNIPLMKTGPRTKLYERRNSLKNFKISPLAPGLVNTRPCSPRSGTPEILSPSVLEFTSLALSPVTPLLPDPFNRNNLDMMAEDKAIKEKGFYLHPSPARETEPRLLPLFPVTSPRAAAADS